MKLCVAGGHATAENNHLNTIDVIFAQGETASEVTSLSFDDVYPIFNQANNHVNNVYAVSVDENEILGSVSNNGDSSSEARASLWRLFVLMGLFAIFRKKRAQTKIQEGRLVNFHHCFTGI
ncbi:hypothetical protein F0250_22045 [Vibrio cyclitrophicus]|uniref:hypothetical protein n=1 Tax=Vibrio cyclitrophicus TaxID=47951 RepID=UPI00148C63B8|nr:hypothetical protein [Vibrio cyclitrophicus]NOI36575.1 hypothetical protein [Vibrio cyclitrophicus]